MTLIALAGALMFAGYSVYGLWSGSLPTQFGIAERKLLPVRFWAWEGTAVACGALCVWTYFEGA